MDNMFLSYYNSISCRTIIIEEDDTVCWAYLTKPNSTDIDMDCWLYNRIDAPSKSDVYKYKNTPPPVPYDFLVDAHCYYGDIKENDVAIIWNNNGTEISVYINNIQVAIIDSISRKTYNINLKCCCPWGNPM